VFINSCDSIEPFVTSLGKQQNGLMFSSGWELTTGVVVALQLCITASLVHCPLLNNL
jgi:hypothetical protein